MTESLTSRPPAEASVAQGLRVMMRGFPTGVAVVTATDNGGRPWGMTCSSLCSVTLEPPTLLVCLRAASPTLAAVLATGTFCVNLLHEDARDTAELFASGAPDRFEQVVWQRDADAAGPHLRNAAHAVADCRIGMTQTAGDHVVLFGEVYRVTDGADRGPLLYGLRSYGRWLGTEPAV